MARRDDEDERWGRQLLVSLVALLAVAGVVGGILAVVALGAARVTGLGGSGPQAQPSLYFPTAKPTVRPQAPAAPTAPTAQASTPPAQPSAQPSPSPSKSPKARKQITLQAFPQQVSPGQRINLTGVYQGAEGATLQVQRDDGSGWQDFPVTVSVSGGTFQTWVTTSHPGKNRFRVVDEGASRRSNPATVTVG